MGIPASSVISKIYMQAHETTTLLTSDTRFVDDVLAIINRSHLEERIATCKANSLSNLKKMRVSISLTCGPNARIVAFQFQLKP